MCLQCFDAVGWAAGRASGLWWGAGMVICLELGVDLHIAQLIRLPLTVSCFSKIQIGFTFLVLAHPGSPGQRAVKCVCVCACVRACVCARVCVSSFIALLLCLRPCYIYIFFELSSHCHSLSLAPVKSRLVLLFWYRLTQVVLEKRPLNGSSSSSSCPAISVCVKKLKVREAGLNLMHL